VRGKGERILLKEITGDTVNAERADVAFPLTTIEGKHYLLTPSSCEINIFLDFVSERTIKDHHHLWTRRLKHC
jgi:hypothetical protein